MLNIIDKVLGKKVYSNSKAVVRVLWEGNKLTVRVHERQGGAEMQPSDYLLGSNALVWKPRPEEVPHA